MSNNMSIFRPSSLFSDEFLRSFFDSPMMTMGNITRGIDIYTKDDTTYVELEVPGYDKSDFKIDIEDNSLTVSAEVNSEDEVEDKDRKYYMKSRSKKSFSQTIYLPHKVVEDTVTAKYEDGYLKLQLPHAQQQKSKTINVE